MSEINPFKKIQGQAIVGKKYAIHKSIHESQNCLIYTIIFEKNSKQIIRVIKLQRASETKIKSLGFSEGPKNYQPTIKKQIIVLKKLFTNEISQVTNEPGFPRIYEYGMQNNMNYMVQDIYGPNLAQLQRLCGGSFSTRTTLVIGLQLIDRLEVLHEKKYLYNNFEPQNFLVGLGQQSYLIFMIDFANSILFKSANDNRHIPYQKRQYDSHSIFSSINSHVNVQISRRDDIQSFLYLLAYLGKGKLPWSKTQGKSQQQKSLYTLKFKQKVPPESLFKNLPFELCDLFYYARSLSFYEKPNYDYIRTKLWGALMSTDYEQLKNKVIQFDWSNRDDIDYEIYRDTPGIKKRKVKISVQSEKSEDSSQNQESNANIESKENDVEENMEVPDEQDD